MIFSFSTFIFPLFISIIKLNIRWKNLDSRSTSFVVQWSSTGFQKIVLGSNSSRDFHFLLQKRIAGSNPGSEWHFSTRILPPCSLNWFSLFWLKKWTSLKPLLAENGRTLSNFPFCLPLFSDFFKKSRFFWIPSLKVKKRFSYDIPHKIANCFMQVTFHASKIFENYIGIVMHFLRCVICFPQRKSYIKENS